MAFNQDLCDERHDNIDEKLDRILILLEGNGKVGAMTRIDRMEQKWAWFLWLMAPIYLGIVGALIKVIYTYVQGNP